MSIVNVYDLKHKSFSRRLDMKTVSTKLGMSNPLFTTKCTGRYRGLSSLSTDDTRMGHSCEKHFSAVFLELSKARASEASIRPRTPTFHIAWPRRKSYQRTTCYARHIRCKSTSPKTRLLGVEVPNELPLKSNSRFAR